MTSIAGIGAAVIGTGFIGTVHVEALRRIGVQVRGVLGSTPERGAARAEALGVGHAYPSLDAVLADDTVDVVHVTSPNHLHHPQAKAILAAGKHVVCEKPLAMTADESAELVRLAAETGLVNATNFNIRYYPLNQHAQELVAGGGLGDVRLVTGRYFQDWLLLDSDWNWRLQPERGGALRAVGDIGSHWLDLMTFVTGQHVSEVMAELTTFIGTRHEPTGPVETFSTERSAETVERPISTEDTATILLRFDGGARGAVSISQISPGRKNSLVYEIDGSEGAWSWDSEQPDQAWQGHRDRPNEILIRNPAMMGAAGQAAAALPGGHVEGFFDTFCAHFRAVYADVAVAGASPHPGYPTFADGHDEMLVGDAIGRSAREGRWVAVDRSPTATEQTATVHEEVRTS
jgi:predicted dehydrogenase